eukprot:5379046-Amphidinium_carterae.2
MQGIVSEFLFTHCNSELAGSCSLNTSAQVTEKRLFWLSGCANAIPNRGQTCSTAHRNRPTPGVCVKTVTNCCER